MPDRFSQLSLTDLISLKQYLMSEENKRKLCREPTERVLEVANQVVVLDREIRERIDKIFPHEA